MQKFVQHDVRKCIDIYTLGNQNDGNHKNEKNDTKSQNIRIDSKLKIKTHLLWATPRIA